MKNKKIVADVILNIISMTLPVVMLQLVFLPQMAGRLGDERFGLVVTITSLMSIVPANIGNVLNNIRLLFDNKYAEKDKGDFNTLMLLLEAVNIAIVFVLAIRYEGGIYLKSLIATIILSAIWFAQSYWIVGFRIELNYTGILYANIWKILGFAVGYLLFCVFGIWQFVYIVGYLFSLIFTLAKTNLWKQKPGISDMFLSTGKQTLYLMFSRVLSSIITYADKLLIYPLLGGTVVSTYYAATIFGKIVSLGISPVNSVVLTYLAKIKKKQDNLFIQAITAGAILCVAGYIVCILISRPVLMLLYPQFADGAMKLIYITTGTAIMQTMIAIADPFVLKFFEMKWQVLLNGCTVVVYIALGVMLLRGFGVTGFCYGVLITNVMKFTIMLLIYHRAKSNIS